MKRIPRFLLKLAIFPLLWVLYSIDDKLFQAIIALIIIIEWPITVAVAIVLTWLSEQAPDIETLTDAANNAITEAIRQTALVFVAGYVILRLTHVIEGGNDIMVVLLAYALILGGFPEFSWLRTLRDVWLPRLRLRR